MLMEPLFRQVDMEKKLTEYFRSSNISNDVALTGMLLARPEDEFVKKEILPNLKYWHFRSGTYVNFFCVGYVPYFHMPNSEPIGVQFGGFEWAFSHESFVEIIREIENQSGWRYTGDPELVLFNAVFNGQKSYLDYSRHLRINLKETKKHEQSPTNIAEAVFDFASSMNSDCNNPIWEFSDRAGYKVLKNGLKEWLLSLLPKSLAAPTKEALIYATHESMNVALERNPTGINNVVRVDFRKK